MTDRQTDKREPGARRESGHTSLIIREGPADGVPICLAHVDTGIRSAALA